MPSIYHVASSQPQRSLLEDRPQLPYLIPYMAFVLVMAPGPMLGHAFGIDWAALWLTWLPALYTIKTILAAILLGVFWRYYTPMRWSHLSLGVLVGIVGVFEWVLCEYASQRLGITKPPAAATIYNPIDRIPNPTLRMLFYVIRIGGPTLVVPVMEELFFRDFLERFFVMGSRFKDVPIGTFTVLSLIGTNALFAISHIQWPAAFIWGAMMSLLLVRTKSLGSCIVAHGTTNLVLYLWVAGYSHDWQFM